MSFIQHSVWQARGGTSWIISDKAGSKVVSMDPWGSQKIRNLIITRPGKCVLQYLPMHHIFENKLQLYCNYNCMYSSLVYSFSIISLHSSQVIQNIGFKLTFKDVILMSDLSWIRLLTNNVVSSFQIFCWQMFMNDDVLCYAGIRGIFYYSDKNVINNNNCHLSKKWK